MTFLPVEMQRPATPADLSMQPDQTLLQTSVIQNGVILRGNLQRIGKDESCLVRQLEKQGYKEAGDGVSGYGGRESGDGVPHGEQAGAGRSGK